MCKFLPELSCYVHTSPCVGFPTVRSIGAFQNPEEGVVANRNKDPNCVLPKATVLVSQQQDASGFCGQCPIPQLHFLETSSVPNKCSHTPEEVIVTKFAKVRSVDQNDRQLVVT